MTWIRLVELFCSCVFQLLLFFWFTQCNVTGPLDDNSPKCRFPLEVSTLEGNELIEWENWARYQLMSVGSDLLGKFSYLQLHDIDPSEFVSTFHLEAGLLEHIYRRVDSCRKHFESAEMAADPQLSVTGVLGFRTVHQVEPKAQMVLVANTSSSNTSDVCPSINQVIHTHDSTIGVLLYCFGMDAAMALNSLYPDGWFALGAAALKARDVEKALDGFTRAVQFDPDNGEAWKNIACLRNSWQLWENYGHVALDVGNIGQALEAVQMVLNMTNDKRIDTELLERIVLDLEGRTSIIESESCRTTHNLNRTNNTCAKDLPVESVHVSSPEESIMGRSRENEHLMEFLGKILQQVVRSESSADMWGLCARWLKSKGDLTMCSEALLKQVRSYQGSDLWKDRDRFKRFSYASLELCKVYMEISSSSGSRRELFAAEMHLKNAEGFSDMEEFRDLQACLDEVKTKLQSGPVAT
ncbi:TPR REGION domain-containing protein [Citrus sinensis]|nr:TPR REGION domain-containing protein [Citrus sinensis]